MTAEDSTPDESNPPDPDATDRIDVMQRIIDRYFRRWPEIDPDLPSQEGIR